LLNLGETDENELYTALDWLADRQPAIETALAKRHLRNGTLVLYDLSSSYMEGTHCKLAHRGYSRDGRKGTLQIVYGLLCAPDGSLLCHSTCYAGGTLGSVARSRSKCLTATPAIRRHWPPRSAS
jgi:hypothetical protein